MVNTAISSPKKWMNEWKWDFECYDMHFTADNVEYGVWDFAIWNDVFHALSFITVALKISLFFLLKIAISHVSVVWQFYYLINIKTTYMQEEWKLENCV